MSAWPSRRGGARTIHSPPSLQPTHYTAANHFFTHRNFDNLRPGGGYRPRYVWGGPPTLAAYALLKRENKPITVANMRYVASQLLTGPKPATTWQPTMPSRSSTELLTNPLGALATALPEGAGKTAARMLSQQNWAYLLDSYDAFYKESRKAGKPLSLDEWVKYMNRGNTPEHGATN